MTPSPPRAKKRKGKTPHTCLVDEHFAHALLDGHLQVLSLFRCLSSLLSVFPSLMLIRQVLVPPQQKGGVFHQSHVAGVPLQGVQ